MPAAPRKVYGTVLPPMPRDCGQVPARPRKSSRDSVAAVFQGLWKITTHTWHQASPPQQRCSSASERGCSPGSPGALPLGDPHSLYQVSSQQGNRLSPCGLKTSGLHSVTGDSPFPPEHHQVLSCGVADFALPLFTVLMEFKPSPFSFSTF